MVNQEKRNDEIESICYMMRWEIGQCEIAPNDWYEKDAQKRKRLIWKRCPERENIDMKKMHRKGKYWNEKDAQMGKDCDEKDEKWFTYY